MPDAVPRTMSPELAAQVTDALAHPERAVPRRHRPRHPSPNGHVNVDYEIRSGIDNHEAVLAAGSLTVCVPAGSDARSVAEGWLWDNHPFVDERIDPSVRITGTGPGSKCEHGESHPVVQPQD